MIKAARPVAAPSPTTAPPSRPPTLKRTPTPAIAPSTITPKPFPTPTTATTPTTTTATSSPAPAQPVQLSGVWLLDVRRSDSVVPLYEYHHVPYSALTVDRDQWVMHVDQKSDRLTVHYYILAASFPVSSFSLSSPPPSYSVSYPISSPTAAPAFHPIRLPHRSTTARCYQAPHLHSVLIDTCCQSKYDLERRECYLLDGALVEEVRVLSCDPTVPEGGGRKGAGVASPFAKGLEGKEVVAHNKTVVKELLMLKRRWTRWDGGGKQKAAGVGAVEEVKDNKGKARVEVKVSDKRKKLSDVKEDEEDDGVVAQLLSPPTVASGARGRPPASTKLSSSSVPPSVPSAPPRSRTPSPQPPAAVVRSPSPLPALSASSLPVPDLTGVYILDKERSQPLAPLLARHHIRVPKIIRSPAALLRQSKQGTKPSPVPLLPVTTCEVVRLSCEQSTITAEYYVCKQWAALPLSSYPTSCFVLVATEHFTSDGVKRMAHSELHPPVEARCVVKEAAIVTVEAEGEVSGGGRWRETSELKRTSDGLELSITRLEAGRPPLVVKRYYGATSGLALASEVKDEHKSLKEGREEVDVARKASIEHDSRGVEDDSVKVVKQQVQSKADSQHVFGQKEEAQEATETEQRLHVSEQQRTEPIQAMADTEAEREEDQRASLEQVEEEDEEEAEEEEEEKEESNETIAGEAVGSADSQAVVEVKDNVTKKEHLDGQPVEEEVTEDDDADTAAQSLPTAASISLTSTQHSATMSTVSTDAEEEMEKEVEAISRSAQTAERVDAAPAVAAVQQALWRRKDVWLAALLAFILLIVWNATRSG